MYEKEEVTAEEEQELLLELSKILDGLKSHDLPAFKEKSRQEKKLAILNHPSFNDWLNAHSDKQSIWLPVGSENAADIRILEQFGNKLETRKDMVELQKKCTIFYKLIRRINDRKDNSDEVKIPLFMWVKETKKINLRPLRKFMMPFLYQDSIDKQRELMRTLDSWIRCLLDDDRPVFEGLSEIKGIKTGWSKTVAIEVKNILAPRLAKADLWTKNRWRDDQKAADTAKFVIEEMVKSIEEAYSK